MKELVEKKEITTQVVLESFEFDFDFSVSNERTLDILKALAKKKGTIQEVLAQAPCQCERENQNSSSLVLSTTRMTFEAKPTKEPTLKLLQADLFIRTPK